MRSVKGFAVLLCLFALSTCPVPAQITITASDLEGQFTVGKVITNWYDQQTTTVNIGSPGSSSWDFSGLGSDSSLVLTSVPVSSTPAQFAAAFPGATHAMEAQIGFQGITGTGFIYLTLNQSALLNPGIYGGTPPDWALQAKIENTPADVTYAFPSTLNTTWTSQYSEAITVYIVIIPGSPPTPVGPPTVTTYNVSYVVDGFGPMTIPGGSTHDALRIKKTSLRNTNASVGYLFVAKDGALVQVTAADTTQPTSGNILVSSISWAAATTTSVQTVEGVPARFALLQNSPNPFNPSTRVYFDLPERTSVTLKVYTTLGQEVATLINGPVEAGRNSVEFDASGLPSGTYLYRLQAGGFVETRKMTLVK